MSKKVKYVSDNTLRYFLQKIKALISGKADKTPATNYANGLMSKEDYSKLHNLKKSDITDFPSTMPASDVYTWAKQSKKPDYTWSEIQSKPDTFPPSTHNHDDKYYTEAEVDKKITDIEVGGRNLLRNTKTLADVKIYDSVYPSKYLESIMDDSGFAYAYLPANNTASAGYVKWVTWLDLPINKKEILNKETILSFEYQIEKKYASEGNHFCIEYYITDKAGSARKYYKLFYLDGKETTEWTKFELTKTITNELFSSMQGEQTLTREECNALIIRIYGEKGFDVKLRKFKFEVGNKSTDWSPAIEDMATKQDVEKDYEIVISNTQPPAMPGKTVLWIKTEVTRSGGGN